MANKSFTLKPGVTTTVGRLFVKEGDAVKAGQKLLELDEMPFYAPFAGTVTALPYKHGETVFAQSVVASVVDLRDSYLVVSLEQRAMTPVRLGQTARLSFESLRERAFDGVVEAIYSNEGSFLVRIGAEGLPPQILPGMTADVAIGVRRKEGALVVPAAAIEEGRLRVSRAGGRMRSVPVKIGMVDETSAEIVEGDLREGDRVALPAGKP